MSKNPTKEDLRAEYEGQVKPKKKKVKKKKEKVTIRKINKLYRSEGRKDRAIQRKVKRLNRIAKRAGSPNRMAVQSGDPLNNYKPYKR